MLLRQTISPAPETDPALDQSQLFAQGLDHVRRFSRRAWTDHNTHDPGITILELLCYALTDLTYRAQFPLEDLLATPAGNDDNMKSQFFTAGEVLPQEPLTASDYRKLLIDHPKIRNAWIGRQPLRYFADTREKRLRRDDPGAKGIRPVDVRGVYRVQIEYVDSVQTEAERQAVNAGALELLHRHRNLCEDFAEVNAVQPQFYSLCAEIELAPDADPAETAAQILFHVEEYLAPPVYNYTLAEMLDKRHSDGTAYTVEEIFTGPRLQNGFIDDAELTAAELRTEVRLSDIISIVMDIDGVLAVRDIVVNELAMQGEMPVEPAQAAVPENKWRLRVPDGKQPHLSLDHQRLVFYKRGLPMPANSSAVDVRLQAIRDGMRPFLLDRGGEDPPIPLGRFRNVASYHSFQHDFPAVYGLSDAGLPGNADDLRRSQALQLKGYLLFFDQMLANYLAQLSQAGRLFSRESPELRTYFAQVVESIPDYERIYAASLPSADGLAMESSASAIRRRNRFLDHLLARIAEDLHHYVSIMQTVFGASEESVLAAKRSFLVDYPQQGGKRGLAYNYTLSTPGDLWDSQNVSGLERRLARLLEIRDVSRRNLATIAYDIDTEIEKISDNEYTFRVNHPVRGTVLSSLAQYTTPEAARARLEQAIQRGQGLDGYERSAVEGNHTFRIVDAAGEALAGHTESFATSEAREAGIIDLADYLREHYGGEGMYVVENILLRPEEEGDPFLPICVDPACSDCADDDPYSYRLQFVLPAYAGRFQNMDFRRFVEETIRMETPAHILPKVCWVDEDRMAKFERAYRDWISLRAGVPTAVRTAKLEALHDALLEIKNVYPRRRLHECGEDNENPPFILDQTQIGTD